MSRIFTTSFASVYPHYVTAVEKKDARRPSWIRIEWLTGFDESAGVAAGRGHDLRGLLRRCTAQPHAASITGAVCGVRVEQVDDPLMQKIRYLDKLVDELAKGKSMDRILRA